MATWMTHFRIADSFIDIIEENNLEPVAFIVGNIAPDAGTPDEDGLTYTPDKEISHFGHSSCRRYDDFINEYLGKSCDNRSRSFFIGYYMHLLTDELWFDLIFKPMLDKYMPSFQSKNACVSAMREEYYAHDRFFIKNNRDFRTYKMFKSIESFPNSFIDFYSYDAFNRQLLKIRRFYDESHSLTAVPEIFISENELHDFCENTVSAIKDIISSGRFFN